MSRNAQQNIKLVVIMSGGVVQAIAYDTDGALLKIDAQVIDYDCPAGGLIIDVAQSDGGTEKAACYPAGVHYLPQQTNALITAAGSVQATRQVQDEKAGSVVKGRAEVFEAPTAAPARPAAPAKKRRRKAQAPAPMAIVPSDIDIPPPAAWTDYADMFGEQVAA